MMNPEESTDHVPDRITSYNDIPPPPRYSDGFDLTTPPPNYSWSPPKEEVNLHYKLDSEVIPAPDLIPDSLASDILSASTEPTKEEEFNLYASTRVGRSRTMSALTSAAATIASDSRVSYISKIVKPAIEFPRGLYQTVPGDDLQRAKVLQTLCDGTFDFIPPVGDRPLIMREGPLLKHMPNGRRTNHHFILLENYLLIGQVSHHKLLILNQFPLITCSISVNPTPVMLNGDSRHYIHKNKIFLIKNPKETFRVETSCVDEKNQWLSDLRVNIEECCLKSDVPFGDEEVEVNQSGVVSTVKSFGPLAPVFQSPVCLTFAAEWIPDTMAQSCMCCDTPFTLNFRRHHCRCCGKVICSPCSEGKMRQDHLGLDAGFARACNTCMKEHNIKLGDKYGVRKYETKKQSTIHNKDEGVIKQTNYFDLDAARAKSIRSLERLQVYDNEKKAENSAENEGSDKVSVNNSTVEVSGEGVCGGEESTDLGGNSVDRSSNDGGEGAINEAPPPIPVKPIELVEGPPPVVPPKPQGLF